MQTQHRFGGVLVKISVQDGQVGLCLQLRGASCRSSGDICGVLKEFGRGLLLFFLANFKLIMWCPIFLKLFFNLMSMGTWDPRRPRNGLNVESSSGLLRRNGELFSRARTLPFMVRDKRYRSTAVKHNHFNDWLPALQLILVCQSSILTLM